MQQQHAVFPIDPEGRLDPAAATYLLLSMTKRCNLRCNGCYFMQQQEDFFVNSEIPLPQAKVIVDYYHNLGIRQVVPDAEGESLLYRDYQTLIAYINAKGFPNRPWLVTNGTLLKRHADFIVGNLKEVLISIDGPDAQSYNAFRGGNQALFDKVTDGVKGLVATARPRWPRPEIIINHVITRDRLEQMGRMIALAEELGVDTIKFSNFHPIGEAGDYRPLYVTDREVIAEMERIMRRRDYRVWIFLPNLFGRQHPPFMCRMLASVVIGANGDFAPCCRIMPDARWGSFFDSPDRHNGEALRTFRRQVLGARSIDELPAQCRECSHLAPIRALFLPDKRQWVRAHIS